MFVSDRIVGDRNWEGEEGIIDKCSLDKEIKIEAGCCFGGGACKADEVGKLSECFECSFG